MTINPCYLSGEAEPIYTESEGNREAENSEVGK